MGAGADAVLVVLSNAVRVNGTDDVTASKYVIFAATGGSIAVAAQAAEGKCLLLTGEPLNEPIAGYGPFVMNTQDEIRQAFTDYQQGRFGAIPAV